MTKKFYNLPRQYSTTTGDSDIELGTAVPGCKTLAQAGFASSDELNYGIITYDTATHRPVGTEVGLGKYLASDSDGGPYLQRTTVYGSVSQDTDDVMDSHITLTGLSEVYVPWLAEDILRVRESDSDPSAYPVNTIVFPAGSVTDNGSGVVTVDFSADSDVVTLTGTQTLTNKTLTTPTIGDFSNAEHNHSDSTEGGTIAHSVLTGIGTGIHLPAYSSDSTTYLNGDGEWTTPAGSGGDVYDSDIIFQDITTGNADSDSHGFLLKLSMNTSHYLRADGSWQAPPAGGTVYDSDIVFSDTTANNADSDQHGFLPKLSGDSTEYLNGDGEWVEVVGGSGIPLDGWNTVGETWTYASADDPVYQIYASGNVTADADYKAGNKVKCTNDSSEFYGFIVKVGSYDSGNDRTPVDFYGGTDYNLANSAITSPYVSKVKSPDGFPLSPIKWTVSFSDTSSRSQASPTQNVWYNLGSLTVNIPIGIWFVSYQVPAQSSHATARSYVTLSTANNSESDSTFTTYGGAPTSVIDTFNTSKVLDLSAKTAYYFNMKTSASGASSIAFPNDQVPLRFSATIVYL
jgi:hypothetical protein